MADAFDPATLAFYASEARPYLAHRPDDISPELPPFLALQPEGARILELGCGGGHDAAHMFALGFAVDPTDGVAAMAAQAAGRLGRPVQVMRFDQLAAVGSYDAVVAMAALLHVPRDRLAGVIARIARALKPGGWHLATYKTNGAAGFDRHGRYYNYPSRADLQAHYAAANGWDSVAFADYDAPGYFGAPARWLGVTARRSETA